MMFPNPYMLYLELVIHIITIRQGGVSLFTFKLVGPKLYIKLLVILGLTYGITYLIIFQQMCSILPLTLYDPGGGALKAHPPHFFGPHAFNFGDTLLCVRDFSQKIV